MTFSVAYVIPPEKYVDGVVVPFRDPNTIISDTAGGGSPGSNEGQTFVTGSVGGGNNADGKGAGLVDGNPDSIVGGTLNPVTDDFSDVGYSEEYAIPATVNNDYSDPNTGLVAGEGGAAPGYLGETVGQGIGGSADIAPGTGYSEVYEIPYAQSDFVVDNTTINNNDAAGLGDCYRVTQGIQ